MKNLFAFLTGVLCCVWAGLAHATPQVNVGLPDVIATVEKSFRADGSGLAPISDVTADFFQRTTLANDRRELRGDGQMWVKMASGSNPIMFRFEYFRPYQQEIVSNGKVLWIYHPENREVILGDVSFLFNHLSFDPDRDRAVNFLQGLGRISRDFQINFASGVFDTAGNYVLELTPRRAMTNTRRIFMVVNRDTVLTFVKGKVPQNSAAGTPPRPQFGAQAPLGSPQSDPFPILSTTVDDQAGNSTTIEFSNIRINNRLPLTTFDFVVPPGVQIIRPSEQNLPR
jgi:outer membrane lipoprotein-sorting protein